MDETLKHKIFRNVGRIQGRCEELGYSCPQGSKDIHAIYDIAEEIYQEVMNAYEKELKEKYNEAVTKAGTYLERNGGNVG